MAKKSGSKARSVKLIVRRSALWRFNQLKKKTAALPVTLSWDRRQDDRRTTSDDVGADRRQQDRRQKPPFTWDVGDFVVVDPKED